MGTARQFHQQTVHFLRKGFTFADNGVSLTVGTIPAGSVILKPVSGVHVSTVFNAGTNNFMDVGTSGTSDLFGTDLSLLTATFVPLDEAVGGYVVAADTTVTMVLQLSGTAATTGAGELVICYIPDSDG